MSNLLPVPSLPPDLSVSCLCHLRRLVPFIRVIVTKDATFTFFSIIDNRMASGVSANQLMLAMITLGGLVL